MKYTWDHNPMCGNPFANSSAHPYAYPCGHLPSEHGPRYGGPSGPQSYVWKSLAMAF